MTEFSIFPNIYNQSPSKTTSRTALSPDKSSKEVMKRVFDVEFALTSSAKKSPLKKTAIISKQQEMDQKMTTMAENLLKMSLLESGKPVDSMKLSFHEQTIIKNDDDFDLDLLHLSYSKFMEYISEDKEYKYASNEEKIIFVLKCFENEDTQISLGSAIFLWDLLYKYKESLSDEEITQILEKVYYLLPFEYENKNFYLLIVFLEIITILGPNEISFSNIKIIASLLKDSSLELVQKSAYLALLNLEYPGFYALCYILNREFTDTPDFILNKLANSTQIQTLVVVPALLNDLSTPIDNKKKIQSLNALNRMYSLIAQGGGLPILIQLLKEGILDRVLIASCLRAAGPEGETILLKLLKNSNISKIKEAIISALAWRIHDTNPLEIRIEEFQVAEHYKQSPGTMCLYYGSLIPCAIEENKQENNYIAINSRDFIAALQRLLTIKYEKFQLVLREKNLKNNNLYNVKVNGIAKDLILTRLFDQNLHSSNTSKIISPEIIKGLISCLSDENPQIRDQAINSIGIIGLPEGLIAFDHLIKCLSDVEAQVRTTAAWSIGIIGINQGNKCLKLLDLLKDSYWKVRTASCIAIGNIGTGISEQAFPILTKILKDGSINKLIICETIVKLGVGGEQILIDILRGTKNNSFKLKASILESFALANVEKPTIDFVIEEIFKHASDSNQLVRKACLITLDKLRIRSQDSNNITYLKSKNILPLFYYFLQDSCQEIRDLALIAIQAFGPQAELIFIEGLTKDKNPIIRAECAKGLAYLGPQNFRVLIFGLRDGEENVRKSTLNSLNKFFSWEDIVEEFKGKIASVPALICSLKEICNGEWELGKTKELLEKVMKELEIFIETNKNTKSNDLNA